VIRFILNDKDILTEQPPGMVLLDLIRYQQHLPGTKIGCREGDCGACTVLIGEMEEGKLIYRSMTSCLLALGNIHGKHVVTIEGINPAVSDQQQVPLNLVQQAMADESATQCGFCTPGFVMSFAGFCMSDSEPTMENAIASVDGNICRCTGYKSIERAGRRLVEELKECREDRLTFSCNKGIVPPYFKSIPSRLQSIADNMIIHSSVHPPFLGGGTDLYVQRHDEMTHAEISFQYDHPGMRAIKKEGNRCVMGGSVTVTDMMESIIITDAIPSFHKYTKLISSTPIRNMATLAGNFVNASPIGDFTIIFLALDATLLISDGVNERPIQLRNFYKGYKEINKKPEEYVKGVSFELPSKRDLFHFEKVSKRTHLDIASVNTAISLSMDGDRIIEAGLSAGGVGPIPLYLGHASAFLKGKTRSQEVVLEMIELVHEEIKPISDTRGSKEYKRLLLEQLIKAHFICLKNDNLGS